MSAPRTPRKVNGTKQPPPHPPVPEPKKILFQSDLPVEQSAYEGTVEALGYEPIIHPYEDEEHKAVYAKYDGIIAGLRELSRE